MSGGVLIGWGVLVAALNRAPWDAADMAFAAVAVTTGAVFVLLGEVVHGEGVWRRSARGESIYDYLVQHTDAKGRLDPDARRMPGERDDDAAVHWAPGARDGVLGTHSQLPLDDDRARAVAVALQGAARQPTSASLSALREVVAEDDVLAYVDRMLAHLRAGGPDGEALGRVARWLATTGATRGAVKVGIAVLALTGVQEHVALLRTLGRHEEFTLYAATALCVGLPDPDRELWALARDVRGWGRIHAVRRLAGTTDPAIRSWILRHGFRNEVDDGYLAHLAATTGDLLGELSSPDADRELLTAAGDVLRALLSDGPATGIETYDDGADAVGAFLAQMTSQAQTLGDLLAVAAVRDHLDQSEVWDGSAARGWTATRREAWEWVCADILGRPVWRTRVEVALLSDEPAEFELAAQAAELLGVDSFNAHLARIRADPYASHWYRAWRQADRPRARSLVALAEEVLPLEAIASGPARELGLEPTWRPHTALDWSLRALRRFPGEGGPLLCAGLRSPVTRNRNAALGTLAEWPRGAWSGEVRAAVSMLALHDPEVRVRELAGALVPERSEAKEESEA